MALVLSTARRVVEVAERVKRANGRKALVRTGLALTSTKTLGIVGMGRIGMALAQRAHFGFGMPILYNARRQHQEAESRFNARYCDLDTPAAGSRLCLSDPAVHPGNSSSVQRREIRQNEISPPFY
jgi:gluconate 2-dehydrogenase